MFLFVLNCVIGILFPVLLWRPGKTAESLRAAACLCAQNIINKLTVIDEIIVKQVNLICYDIFIEKREIN